MEKYESPPLDLNVEKIKIDLSAIPTKSVLHEDKWMEKSNPELVEKYELIALVTQYLETSVIDPQDSKKDVTKLESNFSYLRKSADDVCL